MKKKYFILGLTILAGILLITLISFNCNDDVSNRLYSSEDILSTDELFVDYGKMLKEIRENEQYKEPIAYIDEKVVPRYRFEIIKLNLIVLYHQNVLNFEEQKQYTIEEQGEEYYYSSLEQIKNTYPTDQEILDRTIRFEIISLLAQEADIKELSDEEALNQVKTDNKILFDFLDSDEEITRESAKDVLKSHNDIAQGMGLTFEEYEQTQMVEVRKRSDLEQQLFYSYGKSIPDSEGMDYFDLMNDFESYLKKRQKDFEIIELNTTTK